MEWWSGEGVGVVTTAYAEEEGRTQKWIRLGARLEYRTKVEGHRGRKSATYCRFQGYLYLAIIRNHSVYQHNVGSGARCVIVANAVRNTSYTLIQS